MPTARVIIASSHDSMMRYATGLHVLDPFVWIRFGDGKRAKQCVLVSALEYGRIKEEARSGMKVILLDKVKLDNIKKPVRRHRNLADIAAAVLLAYNITEAVIPENTWTIHTETLREHGLRVRTESPYFPQRAIKNDVEIAAIKHAGLVAKRALARAITILKESSIEWNDTLIFENKRVTSESLKQEIERVFLEHGCTSGETIVSCGDQSALPHHRGSGPLFAGRPIIIDLFPRDVESGYHFDMTRTIIKGTPTKELRRMYDAVHKSQLAGLSAVKPGRKASDVHDACATTFTRLGYKTTDEEGFIHSTGHGLGLDIHESPGIGAKSDDLLAPGNVITIEPGLYYKEIGGIRIEDTVLVTKSGCANLTNVPKVFVIR